MDIDTLLDDARMAAVTDWEEGFVADLIERRKTWGDRFELTPAQRTKLEEILNPSED